MKVYVAALTAACLLRTLDAAVIARPTLLKREMTTETTTVTAPCTLSTTDSGLVTVESEPVEPTESEDIEPLSVESTGLAELTPTTAEPTPSEPEITSTPSPTPSSIETPVSSMTAAMAKSASYTIYDIWSTKTVPWQPPPPSKAPEISIGIPELHSLACPKMVSDLLTKYHCPGA